MKKFLLVFIVGISSIGIWNYLVPHYLDIAKSNYLSKRYKHIDVRIRSYPIPREIHWSGIFPFYGGLISDPHILEAEPKLIAKEILEFLELHNGRVEGYSINHFFNQKYYKFILALELDNMIYSLQLPLNKDVYNLEMNSIFPFLLEGKLCFYISNSKTLIVETEYTKTNKSYEALKQYKLYEENTKEWDAIIKKLKKEHNINYFLEDIRSARNNSANSFSKIFEN